MNPARKRGIRVSCGGIGGPNGCATAAPTYRCEITEHRVARRALIHLNAEMTSHNTVAMLPSITRVNAGPTVRGSA